jgi:hypothetical protein
LGIDIANGSGVEGLDQRVGIFLKKNGYERINGAKGDCADQTKTSIQYSTGYLHPAYRLAQLIPGYQEMEDAGTFDENDVKVRVLLGRDMVHHNLDF